MPASTIAYNKSNLSKLQDDIDGNKVYKIQYMKIVYVNNLIKVN